MVKVILLLIAIGNVAIMYSCLIIAGRWDDAAEKREKHGNR